MSDTPETASAFTSPAPDGPPSAETLAHVQHVWDEMRPKSSIYDHLLGSDAQLILASPGGRVVTRLPLSSRHVNSRGTLHGAVSATLVDWAGGMAIAAATGKDKTGVSTDIHVTYLSAAREGDVLEIDAWASKVGRNLAFTNVEIRKVGGGKVAMGTHTKVCTVLTVLSVLCYCPLCSLFLSLLSSITVLPVPCYCPSCPLLLPFLSSVAVLNLSSVLTKYRSISTSRMDHDICAFVLV